MKNSIIKFEKEVIGDIKVSDYFSKRCSDFDIINKEYIDFYETTDNDKLERISFELYGTEDYWDILLLMNNKDPLFDMSYDFDFIYDATLDFINKYGTEIYFNSFVATLNQDRTDELFNEKLEKNQIKNEKLRIIKIIKPERLNDFLKDIKGKFI